MPKWDRSIRIAAILGVAGLVIEAIAITLLATDRISSSVGKPLVVAGMLIAFVPLFVLSRRARR